MNNKTFDAALRAAAQREKWNVSEHTNHRLMKTIQNPTAFQKVRRLTARTLAIALIAVLLISAVAYAATQIPSIVELYEKWFGDPKTVAILKEQTVQEQSAIYELQDVDVTLSEVIFDGNTLYATGLIKAKEDRNVILIGGDYGPNDAYAIDAYRGVPVPKETVSYREKAEQTGARLLRVSAGVEAARDGGSGSYMKDCVIHADGTISFITEFSDVAVDENGLIHAALNAQQIEITKDGMALEDTRNQQSWHFTVEAIAKELHTPVPTPVATPIPAKDEAQTLIVIGGNKFDEGYLAFQKQNPETLVDFSRYRNYLDAERLVHEMLKQRITDWDVMYCAFPEASDLRLIRSGTTADLNTSAYLKEQIAQMYPNIQSLVGSQGKLLAIPYWPSVKHYPMPHVKHFEELGITIDPLPRTFDELLELVECYLDLPLEKRSGYTLAEMANRDYLTSFVLDMQTILCRYENKPLTYDTPELKALLERIGQLTQRIQNEEKPWSENENSGRKLLFGQARSSYTLYEGAPAVLEGRAGLYLVNPNSPRLEKAIGYVECIVKSYDEETKQELYPALAKNATQEQAYYEGFMPEFETGYDLSAPYAALRTKYYEGELTVDAFLKQLEALFERM